jgi:predicted SnoaL-like aldol condensation-catalyzing enzyme
LRILKFFKEIIMIDRSGPVMSVERNKAAVRKMIEEANKRDQTVINAMMDKFIAADFIDHSSLVRGRENVKKEHAKILKEIPDLHLAIEDIIAEGDKVWFLERSIGTATSGKKLDATSLNILRIVDGKAVEGWGGYLQKTA